jgi:hypothetical protein
MTVVHPSYEKIVRYVRGYLGAPRSPEVVRLEEHLLSCSHCILRAERAVEFGQALRAAVCTPLAAETIQAEKSEAENHDLSKVQSSDDGTQGTYLP